MHITGASVAGHSTWLHFPQFRFMIDAGEGAATSIGASSLGAVSRVFITHDHWDHIAGLIQLVNLRTRTQEGKIPLEVYYPYETKRLDTIAGLFGNKAKWNLLPAGDKIDVTPQHYITPFPVRHAGGKAVGYKLFEKRTRLAKAYSDISKEDIRRLVRDASEKGDKLNLNESFDYHLLTHTGDTMPLSPEEIGTPDILSHEATYPTTDMMDGQEHSSLEDALKAFHAAKAKSLILHHLSVRYRENPGSLKNLGDFAKGAFPYSGRKETFVTP